MYCKPTKCCDTFLPITRVIAIYVEKRTASLRFSGVGRRRFISVPERHVFPLA